VTRRARQPRYLIALLGALVAVLLVPAVPAAAKPGVLDKAQARDVALKTAKKVRRDLESEGARDFGVAGCWRNSARRVSCYLKVTGYDSDLEFRWTCMLRMVVELQVQPSGAQRLKSRYGNAVCG
jgi:hypothetical protein